MLEITGPDGSGYVLGAPIWVWSDTLVLGRVNSVHLDPRATVATLGDFAYAPDAKLSNAQAAKLLLLEVTARLLEVGPDLKVIHFVLDHPFVQPIDSMKLAVGRVRLLRSIGAEDVKAVPSHAPGREGQFDVTATWVRSKQNVESLHARLAASRDADRRKKTWRNALPDWLGGPPS